MMVRCYVEIAPSYENYGGRGVSVDEDWWWFKNFLRDMGLKPTSKHTLERIDNSKNYSKDQFL
jgi:hypothetical protein